MMAFDSFYCSGGFCLAISIFYEGMFLNTPFLLWLACFFYFCTILKKSEKWNPIRKEY